MIPGSFSYGFKMVLCLAWGIPWNIAGVACCATIILWPIGLPLIAIGSAPLVKLNKNRNIQVQNWKAARIEMMREQQYKSEEPDIPWKL